MILTIQVDLRVASKIFCANKSERRIVMKALKIVLVAVFIAMVSCEPEELPVPIDLEVPEVPIPDPDGDDQDNPGLSN